MLKRLLAAIFLLVNAVFLIINFGFISTEKKSERSVTNSNGEVAIFAPSNQHDAEVLSKPLKSVHSNSQAININQSSDASASIMVLDPKFVEVEQAKDAIRSDDVVARIDGIMTLASTSPSDAVDGLDELLSRHEEEPSVEGAIVLGMLSLAHNKDEFPDYKIADIYMGNSSENIRGRAARVLAARGDDSYLKNHLENISQNILGGSDAQVIDGLRAMQNLETDLAVSHIKNYLHHKNQDIRFAALAALSSSGNIEHLELVRPLMMDKSTKVQVQAEMVINQFLVIGDEPPSPVEISGRS